MYRLSDELPNVNLAFSLHAPNQDIRVKIVPAARSFPLWKLMDAVDYHIMKNTSYYDKERSMTESTEEKNIADTSANAITNNNNNNNSTGGPSSPVFSVPLDGNWKVARATGIMIEYILIRDLNDRVEHAHELAQLLQSRRAYIMLNLIPYNPTEVAEDFFPPTEEQVERFAKICMSEPYFIHTRVRQEKGQDIAGACGQLALVKKANQTNSNHNHNHHGSEAAVDAADNSSQVAGNHNSHNTDVGQVSRTVDLEDISFVQPSSSSMNIHIHNNDTSVSPPSLLSPSYDCGGNVIIPQPGKESINTTVLETVRRSSGRRSPDELLKTRVIKGDDSKITHLISAQSKGQGSIGLKSAQLFEEIFEITNAEAKETLRSSSKTSNSTITSTIQNPRSSVLLFANVMVPLATIWFRNYFHR
jgi:hypothetical protein